LEALHRIEYSPEFLRGPAYLSELLTERPNLVSSLTKFTL